MIRFITPLAPRASEIANLNSKIADRLEGTDLFSAIDLESHIDRPEWNNHLRRNSTDGDILEFVHLGNNHIFHSGCLRYSLAVPSICVLHDRNLSGLIRGAHITSPDLRDLISRKWIYRNGPDGFERFKKALNNPMPGDELDTGSWGIFADNALAVVTHNKVDVSLLKSETDVPIFDIDLPHFFDASRPYRVQYKAGDTLKLIMFGFIGGNRRARAVVEAVRAFSSKYPVKLHIYGKLSLDPVDLEFIEQACVEGLVKKHGFVADDELEAALRSSHLAINLRYPTMGEASSSQLRIFEAGLPSVVTDVGWYGKLPDNAVFKISHDHEQKDLLLVFDKAVNDPMRFEGAGAQGRLYLEKVHRFDRYFDKISALKMELPRLQREWTRRRVIERISWKNVPITKMGEVRKEISETVLNMCGKLFP